MGMLLDLFRNKWPYTDFHELNADWIISAVRELIETMDSFIQNESISFADPITWNISSQYAKATVVLDSAGNAYLSKQAVPAGVQLNNSEYWQEIFNFTNYTRTANRNLTFNVETDTTRATAAYSVDDWLILNDVLYRVTQAIAIDDTFIIAPAAGSNIVHFTVEDFIKAWMTNATALINQYKTDIDASELAYRQQLAQDIATTTASLQAQLDQAISGATVDSEVILARVGYNNITYPTLRDAIVGQVEDLYTYINHQPIEWINNIMNTADVVFNPLYTSGYRLNSSGGIQSDASRMTSLTAINIEGASELNYNIAAGYRIYIACYNAEAAQTSDMSHVYGWLTGSGTQHLSVHDKFIRITIADINDGHVLDPSEASNVAITFDYDLQSALTFKGQIANNTDFNTLQGVGYYGVDNAYTFTNAPTGFTGGTLLVMYGYKHTLPSVIQMAISSTDNNIWVRYITTSGTWKTWVAVSEMDYKGGIAANTDLDTVTTLGNYNIPNNYVITNKPDGFTGGSLHVFYAYGHNEPYSLTQMLVSPFNRNIWLRYRSGAGVWQPWQPISRSPIIGDSTKWLAVGDSITYGVYSYLDSEDVAHSGVTTLRSWVRLLADGTGYDLKIMASRGMGYTVTGQDPDDSTLPRITISDLMDRIEALPDDYNLVTVMFGINDYNSSTSTVAGIVTSFNSFIQRLITKFPHARVVVFSPLNERRRGDSTTNYAYKYAYSGRTLKDIADAIKERCEYYGVEYYNVANQFVFNNFNIVELEADEVHPTLIGHDLIAKTMAHILY